MLCRTVFHVGHGKTDGFGPSTTALTFGDGLIKLVIKCGVVLAGWGGCRRYCGACVADGAGRRVGRVLGDARSLYGAAPQGGGWSSTQMVSAGRDGVGTAGAVVAG
jgi:hypothetical protein